MKKQKIQILILLVLCIVCVGGYFIIRNHTFETEEETVSVDVTNFNKDDVTELILSGDHEVHLVKTDDAWTESSLPDETIKESTVNTLLNEIANITTTETVVEAPEDLSQYGLEEPFRTITAVLSDGTQVVIYAGNKSDLLSEYYIKVEGDDNVYLVSSNIVTDFDKDPEDFIDETETETATEETADSADETAATDAIEETAAAKTLESADGETESADADGENAEDGWRNGNCRKLRGLTDHRRFSLSANFEPPEGFLKTPGRREIYSLFPGIFFAIRRTI